MIDRIGLPTPLAPACPDSGIPAGASPDRAPLAPGLPGLSVILPSFNVAAIQDVATAAAACSEAYEVIVVDDGAAQLAAGFVAADGRARLVVHPAERGYGAALRSGVRAARMPWVLLSASSASSLVARPRRNALTSRRGD